MARRAGEGKDWIELMTQTQHQKEDVIRNVLKSMKQPVVKKKKKSPKDLCRQRNQEICLPPSSLSLDLGTLVCGEKTDTGNQGGQVEPL